MPAEAGKYVCLIASLLCPHKLRSHFISSSSTRGKHQTSLCGTRAPTQEKESLLLKHSQRWLRERESYSPRMSTESNPAEHTSVSQAWSHTGFQMFEEGRGYLWGMSIFELICIQANQYFILPTSSCNVFYSCNTILWMLANISVHLYGENKTF